MGYNFVAANTDHSFL